MKLGKHEAAALAFCQRLLPGRWHAFAQDALTLRTVRALQRRGLIETNTYGMMRLARQKHTTGGAA